MADPICLLAENVVKIGFEDLPSDVVEFTKLCVLDALGALVAGFDAPGCRIAVDLIKKWGGRPESSVLRYGVRVPSPSAAFVNSILTRALDFDTGCRPGLHLNASTVPTALAIGEMTSASGKDVIASIAVGEDMALRINRTTNYGITYRGFDPTGICGVFATAAVTGKLLDLNAEEMRNALGIAFNKAAGSFQSNIDGALAVRFIQGFTSSSGVVSAILAKSGVTGVINVLEGVYGYYNLFSGGKYDRNSLLENLGKEFLAPSYTMFKRWPSCGATLSLIDGALELREKHNIRAEDVSEVIAIVGPYAYNLVGHSFKVGDNPQVNAQFSIQYGLSNVLVRGKPKLEHYTDKYVIAPEVQNFLQKVKIVEDKTIDTEFKAKLQIKLKNGQTYKKLCGPPKGHPDNPITKEDLLAKFKDCAKFSPKPLSDEIMGEVQEKILNLDKITDIRELIELLYE